MDHINNQSVASNVWIQIQHKPTASQHSITIQSTVNLFLIINKRWSVIFNNSKETFPYPFQFNPQLPILVQQWFLMFSWASRPYSKLLKCNHSYCYQAEDYCEQSASTVHFQKTARFVSHLQAYPIHVFIPIMISSKHFLEPGFLESCFGFFNT